MGLTSGWFKNRLTKAKQNSVMQSGFADIVETLFIDAVEPYLERLTERKSFFSMTDEDLDTRISEMGQFFTIRASDASSKPMLLQQRLDEIHFKGTQRPIIQTFYREFHGVPITWQPIYAPINQEKYPYGTVLVSEDNLESVGSNYGEMFLTSRGVVSISYQELTDLITIGNNPDITTVAQVTQAALTKFKQVVVPLLPLHVVFGGLQLLYEWTITEPEVSAYLRIISVSEEIAPLVEVTEAAVLETVTVELGEIEAIDLIIETQDLVAYDDVLLDGWEMDRLSGIEGADT
ncbi:phage tail protein [Nissabacter sp. SGAir0207]|uniref:phage tail protein n=1 Tax=Nissabacter sp. SGAir0207 TaxID=2126321 RepID=UPI0010CD5B82|nr:phage tail protein [Nissabacter sp. SGAir0207]QCR38730.1 phage tail protein [Nissabacter sp. SGAir0207]